MAKQFDEASQNIIKRLYIVTQIIIRLLTLLVIQLILTICTVTNNIMTSHYTFTFTGSNTDVATLKRCNNHQKCRILLHYLTIFTISLRFHSIFCKLLQLLLHSAAKELKTDINNHSDSKVEVLQAKLEKSHRYIILSKYPHCKINIPKYCVHCIYFYPYHPQLQYVVYLNCIV